MSHTTYYREVHVGHASWVSLKVDSAACLSLMMLTISRSFLFLLLFAEPTNFTVIVEIKCLSCIKCVWRQSNMIIILFSVLLGTTKKTSGLSKCRFFRFRLCNCNFGPNQSFVEQKQYTFNLNFINTFRGKIKVTLNFIFLDSFGAVSEFCSAVCLRVIKLFIMSRNKHWLIEMSNLFST